MFLALTLVTIAFAQSPEPPLSDTRLTIHTLVREDIFAGFLVDDMDRLSRGEKNIEILLEKRPTQKANLLAWKAGATLYRAVRAYENKQDAEFQKNYQTALELFSQANKAAPGGDGVAAVTGGSYVLFADRLPKEKRAAAWSEAYGAYTLLWKQQEPIVDKLPVHMRGELLGGLAQSAQRTGRTEETTKYLDKILEVLPNTPYEPVARQWKKNPEAAANTSITCMTCHDSGRLSARLAAINGK
jgi:tetratricopeptide (TPR) repeat protein